MRTARKYSEERIRGEDENTEHGQLMSNRERD